MIEMKDKYYCFQCGDELSPENNGMLINDGEFAQCDDCHEIEHGVFIWPALLLYDTNIVYWCGNCEDFSHQPNTCDRCGWSGILNPISKNVLNMEEELKKITDRLEFIFGGKNPKIEIYGDGSWSVEIDGTYETVNGEKPCRVGGFATGSTIKELYKFLKFN